MIVAAMRLDKVVVEKAVRLMLIMERAEDMVRDIEVVDMIVEGKVKDIEVVVMVKDTEVVEMVVEGKVKDIEVVEQEREMEQVQGLEHKKALELEPDKVLVLEL